MRPIIQSYSDDLNQKPEITPFLGPVTNTTLPALGTTDYCTSIGWISQRLPPYPPYSMWLWMPSIPTQNSTHKVNYMFPVFDI